MVRTFLDSGVLIAAASGNKQEKQKARAILTDPDRRFVTSPFVELECLPHAEREGTEDAVLIYRAYFAAAEVYSDLEAILQTTGKELRKTNMKLVDAIHVATAHLAGADELLTTERPTKAMHRNTLVKVRTLR